MEINHSSIQLLGYHDLGHPGSQRSRNYHWQTVLWIYQKDHHPSSNTMVFQCFVINSATTVGTLRRSLDCWILLGR